jgi:hypothetical protein
MPCMQLSVYLGARASPRAKSILMVRSNRDKIVKLR